LAAVISFIIMIEIFSQPPTVSFFEYPFNASAKLCDLVASQGNLISLVIFVSTKVVGGSLHTLTLFDTR